jgi:hypothetical protein
MQLILKLAFFALTFTSISAEETTDTSETSVNIADIAHPPTIFQTPQNLTVEDLKLVLFEKFTVLVKVSTLSLTPSSLKLPRTSVRTLSFRRKNKKTLMCS